MNDRAKGLGALVSMVRRRRGRGASVALSVALGAFVVSGCGEAPQAEHTLELVARSQEPGVIVLADGAEVTLTRAEVAFGPLYLCPGTTAGEACDVARFEWRDSAVVDLLDDTDQPLGELIGVTGSVHSWMFDYGITSLLTADEPFVSDAARALGGVSLRLEGTALVSGSAISFSLDVRVAQGADVERGVQVVRKSSADDFDDDVTLDSEHLNVAFDVRPWVTALMGSDFCLEEPCPGEIVLPVDSPAAGRVGQTMVAGARPEFSLR